METVSLRIKFKLVELFSYCLAVSAHGKLLQEFLWENRTVCISSFLFQDVGNILTKNQLALEPLSVKLNFTLMF